VSPTDATTARIVDEVPTAVEYSVSRLARGHFPPPASSEC